MKLGAGNGYIFHAVAPPYGSLQDMYGNITIYLGIHKQTKAETVNYKNPCLDELKKSIITKDS